MNDFSLIIDDFNHIVNNFDSIDHFDIVNYFNKYDDNTLERIIDYYLRFIKDNTNSKDLNKYINKANKFIDTADYNYFVLDVDARKDNYSIMEEAHIICDDLLKKCFNYNNRSIDWPISINNIINYSITYFVNEENVYKVIYFIICKLGLIYSYIKNNT